MFQQIGENVLIGLTEPTVNSGVKLHILDWIA